MIHIKNSPFGYSGYTLWISNVKDGRGYQLPMQKTVTYEMLSDRTS